MKYSSFDNLAETLSFCILKKGKIENFGYLLQTGDKLRNRKTVHIQQVRAH